MTDKELHGDTVTIETVDGGPLVVSETVITCDPDAPPTDIPSHMYGSGFDEGIKATEKKAAELLEYMAGHEKSDNAALALRGAAAIIEAGYLKDFDENFDLISALKKKGSPSG